jgi:hypothetical protein
MPSQLDRREALAEYLIERLIWREEYAVYERLRKKMQDLLHVDVITKCTGLSYMRSH